MTVSRSCNEIYGESDFTVMHLALLDELLGAKVLSGSAWMEVVEIEYLNPGWGLVLSDGSVMAVSEDYEIVYEEAV